MPSVQTLRHRVTAALALGLLPSALVAVPAKAAVPAEGMVEGTDSPDAVAGRYIVVMKPGKSTARTTPTGTDDVVTMRLSAVEARRMAADPAVEVVEQDRIVRTEAVQRNPVWGLDRIDQRATKSSGSFQPMADGNSVHAYVLDTGINIGHSQFGGRASYGYDFASDDPYAADCSGHGTHVAGTIGGSTYGVAKGVRLVALRVLDCNGVGYMSDIIAGVNWVTTHAIKPAVANMSLGSNYSRVMEAAVQRSIDSGVTYVVAAGNSNANALYDSPSGLAAAISVAATDRDDRRAYFSNWGPAVDLFAPGVDIKSAWYRNKTATQVLSGTSMAAPHVAGAAALLLDAFPAYRPAQVSAYLTSRATTGRVKDPKKSPNRLLYSPPPPAAPRIATSALPKAKINASYAVNLSLVASRRGTWTLVSGTLPAGLSMSAAGAIFGTPKVATATRKIVVRFSDFVPQSVTRTMYITVGR